MSYLVTVKPSHNGRAFTATVTRSTAVGISRTLAAAAGSTQAQAVARVKRDVRTMRVCGQLK